MYPTTHVYIILYYFILPSLLHLSIFFISDTSISHEVPSNAHTENQPIEQLDSQTTGVQPIGQIDSQTTGVQPIGQPDIQTTGVGQPNLGSPTTIVQPREKGGSTTSWCRISYRGRFIQCHTNTMCLFFSQVFLIGFAIVAVFAIDQRAFLVGKVTQDQNPTIPSIYSPGDSRLIPLTFSSRILHNMIWFEVTGHDICSSATMYLVEEYKYLPLKYNNTVQIKKPYTVHNNTFRYWMFYLHPQSEINGTICPSTPLEAFIIKGKTNFMLWRDLRAPEYADVHFNCSDNGIKNGYKISEKDYYFIVVLNRRNMQQVEIVSDLNITRFGYVTMDPYQNCTSLPFNPCALSIPFDLVTQYNVLITTSIPAHEVNWENEIDIKIYYRYRIPIVFLFICYAIFNFAVLFCYCF